MNDVPASSVVPSNANTHPSIGNYFMLTTGQIITNHDGFSGTVTQDNNRPPPLFGYPLRCN